MNLFWNILLGLWWIYFEIYCWDYDESMLKYSKTCLKRPLKRRPKLVSKTDYCLMQVKSIAECSTGSILHFFWPSLSYHLSLRSLFCLVLSGRLKQVWQYTAWIVMYPTVHLMYPYVEIYMLGFWFFSTSVEIYILLGLQWTDACWNKQHQVSWCMTSRFWGWPVDHCLGMHALFVCLIWFFTSHQQSFSYKGTGLRGLNQYLARVNVLAQGHNAVMPVRLKPMAPSVLSQALYHWATALLVQ